MSDPYIGEIRMFGGSFPPSGWAFCHGQLMPISENDALFTLIGTTYGGDGQETFGLPNLQGRLPMHMGTALGQTMQLGEMGGVESVTLTTNQMPAHTHPVIASAAPGFANRPTGMSPGTSPNVDLYGDQPTTNDLSPNSVIPAGGSQPHDNMQPFLAISYIISLFGIFPTQF